MSSETSNGKEKGFAALSEGELEILADRLGLFASHMEDIGFPKRSGYNKGNIPKKDLISALQAVESRYGPLLIKLKIIESRIVFPERESHLYLPRRHIIDMDKLNRLRKDGITLPITQYLDLNTYDSSTTNSDDFYQEWLVESGRFECAGCREDVMDCSCGSMNDYIVAFLMSFFIQEGYNQGESYFWALYLRYPNSRPKVIEPTDSKEYIESKDWLKIPLIREQPIHRLFTDENDEMSYTNGKVRSIRKIAHLSALGVFYNRVDRHMKKVLMKLREVASARQGQWYCTCCKLPVIGLDTCFVCGVGTREEARIAHVKLMQGLGEIERQQKSSNLIINPYCLHMNRKRLDEAQAAKQYDQMVQEQMAKLNQKQTDEAKIYLDQGLEIDFVIPLVLRVVSVEDLMSFWHCQWRKQYSMDDSLVQLVLTGRLSHEHAEALNTIRSTSDLIYNFILKYNDSMKDARKAPITQAKRWQRILSEVKAIMLHFGSLDGELRERATLAIMAGVDWMFFHENHNVPLNGPSFERYRVSWSNDKGETHLHKPIDLTSLKEFFPNVPFEYKFRWTKWNRLYFGHLILGMEPRLAKAFANGNIGYDLLKFYRAGWPKQYAVNDYMIKSFLDEKLTLTQITKLNSMRSNHELLVRAVALHPGIYEWAVDLLEAGFDEHPKAVLAALDGAEPLVLRGLYSMKEKAPLPPALEIDLKKVDLELDIEWLEDSIDFKK